MKSFLVSTLVLSMLTLPLATARAAERPGRLPSETRQALIQGLQLSFQQGALTDTRSSRLAALYVPANEVPSPFLASGPFAAQFTGYLKLKLRGEYTLYVEGNGTVAITLNGKSVLSVEADAWKETKPVTVELIKGYNEIEIDYRSTATGDSNLRVFWSSEEEGFPKEPLPADLLFHDGRSEELATGNTLRRGRELFATHRCIACHATELSPEVLQHGMKELATDAPSLANVGSRLTADWLTEWIAKPDAMRTHTTMPHLLKGDKKTVEQQATDLAAFLATLTSDAEHKPLADSEKLAEQGEALFEQLGCIACHTFNKPVGNLMADGDEETNEAADVEQDEYDRITLHFANAKFKPGRLVEFLRNPREHYRASRMPDFHLSEDEAAALAAFVRAQGKGEVAKSSAGDAKRGRELFATAGCAQCHATTKDLQLVALKAKPLFGRASAGGCLAKTPQAAVPNFHFSDQARAALAKFLANGAKSLTHHVASEFSHRQVKSLRCTACHQRDTTDADLPYILDDEGVLGETPPMIPPLTWTGEKLQPKWSGPFISGKHSINGKPAERPRPWLKLRMPGFAERGEALAVGLSHEHGYATDFVSPHTPSDAKDQIDIGRQLTLKEGGFNCQQCHGAGKTPAVAPFEAPGINLAQARDRLRYDFYHRWMLDPLRIDAVTKMPKLTPDSRTTGLKHVYDGDANRQFNAIWQYIQSLEDH